jgi:cysteine-rich repeat protein
MGGSSGTGGAGTGTGGTGTGTGGTGGGPPIGTADYPAEVEQNNLKSTANPLAAGTKGFTGTLNLGDVDVFSVFVTPAGSGLRVELGNGMGGCVAGSAKVSVSGANGALAGSSGSCVLLVPPQDPGLSNLAEDTYYVQIESATLSPIPLYVVDIRLLAAGCGDGLVQVGEQCDDGNTTAGDGCSDTCQLEGNYLTETEPNNTQATRNQLGPAEGFVGAISPAGDQDYFSFDVTVPGSSVFIETSDAMGGCPSGFDSTLTLYDASAQQLAYDDDGGVSLCSAITPSLYPAATNLAPGAYSVHVADLGNNSVISSYLIDIKVAAPGCGDGAVQTGEQCDDGNTTAGDGCSDTCQAEPPWEIEPNSASGQATPLWPGYSYWRGSIAPIGDHDYFTFDVPPGGASVKLETHDVGNPATCSFDSHIHLVNNANMLVAESDDEGIDTCSLLDPAAMPVLNNLAAGKYYVWVQRYGDSLEIPAYELTLTIQ